MKILNYLGTKRRKKYPILSRLITFRAITQKLLKFSLYVLLRNCICTIKLFVFVCEFVQTGCETKHNNIVSIVHYCHFHSYRVQVKVELQFYNCLTIIVRTSRRMCFDSIIALVFERSKGKLGCIDCNLQLF